MRQLTSIVAVNQDGVIGAGNSLPWRIRSDLKFFRETTEENVVIMGRKTYESLGGPLKNRLNIVVTHGFGLFVQSPSCLVAHSIDEALAIAEIKKGKRQEVFVIGGATMYEQFVPFVDRYLITDVSKHVPDGDTFFSRDIFDPLDNWQINAILSGEPNDRGDEVAFRTYELIAKDGSPYESRRTTALQNYIGRSHFRATKAKHSSYVEMSRLSA